MKFSQPTAARELNRLRVLNTLAQDGPCSRAELSRILKLNKPSTSEIIAQLLAEEMVVETGTTTTSNGRRPMMIELKNDAQLVLGVDMGSRNTTFALADLKGNLLRYERFPTPFPPDAKEHGQQIIKTCMKLAKLAPSPIAGITVAINAQISEDKLTIKQHEIWDWKQIPLAVAIQKHTKRPTILVHNVKAMVKGEQWFSPTEGKDFLYVNWAEHIGLAWVNERGIVSDNTQFGHLPVAQTGLCRCGSIGCLETVASGWALSEKQGGLSVKQIASANTEDSKKILRQACQAMAMALIAATSVTGTSKIILGGGIANLDQSYLTYLSDFYSQHAHKNLSKIPVVRSQLGEKAGIMGSIAIALDTWVFHRSLLDTINTL